MNDIGFVGFSIEALGLGIEIIGVLIGSSVLFWTGLSIWLLGLIVWVIEHYA